MKAHLVAQIQSCIDAGALPSHLNANVVFRVLTMGLLGAAMMRLSDRLVPGENPDTLARDVLDGHVQRPAVRHRRSNPRSSTSNACPTKRSAGEKAS